MIPTERLSEDRLEAAGTALARAFYDDPLWRHIIPAAAARARALPAFFTATAAYGRLNGRVDTTTDVAGAAVWIPPSTASASDAGTEASEYGVVEDLFDRASAARFTAMVDHYRRLRSRDMARPHWYLACLGVDPPRQRQGIASALLAPVLALADETALPCYLETENVVNLTFYQRSRFERLASGHLPGGGPEYWTMWRRPATAR